MEENEMPRGVCDGERGGGGGGEAVNATELIF